MGRAVIKSTSSSIILKKLLRVFDLNYLLINTNSEKRIQPVISEFITWVSKPRGNKSPKRHHFFGKKASLRFEPLEKD
jgi:hypothetical protein